MDSRRAKNERITINKEFESFDDFIQEYVTNISRTGRVHQRADARCRWAPR